MLLGGQLVQLRPDLSDLPFDVDRLETGEEIRGRTDRSFVHCQGQDQLGHLVLGVEQLYRCPRLRALQLRLDEGERRFDQPVVELQRFQVHEGGCIRVGQHGPEEFTFDARPQRPLRPGPLHRCAGCPPPSATTTHCFEHRIDVDSQTISDESGVFGERQLVVDLREDGAETLQRPGAGLRL